jgi:hypothetical protein
LAQPRQQSSLLFDLLELLVFEVDDLAKLFLKFNAAVEAQGVCK